MLDASAPPKALGGGSGQEAFEMYNDLPVTGIGAALLAVVGAGFWAVRALARLFGPG